MPAVLDRIREWSAELLYWEQRALNMVVSDRDLTEADYQELLDYCMQDAGLVHMPTRPKISFPRTPAVDEKARYRLDRLFNLRNVNALASGQELQFGPQLTAVYGNNGTGKTGYVRPLGCAGFARGDRDVLPNARVAARPDVVPQADIEVSTDGSKNVLTWTRGQRCAELQGFWVFDTASLSVHLTRSNALSISPSGLSVLTRLSDVTDAVRERFRSLLEQRDRAFDVTPLFVGESAVASCIQALEAHTNVAELEKLAYLTPDELSKIEQLPNEIAELRGQDVSKSMQNLRQGAADLRGLLSSLEAANFMLGDAAASRVRSTVENLERTEIEAERSGAEQFKAEFLSEVGTEIWREFVAAAKVLADAEAKRGVAYPTENDRCLLCRQPLSPQAINLVQRLWRFVESDSASQLQAARRSGAANIHDLEQVNTVFFADDLAVKRLLTSVAPDLMSHLEAQVAAYSARRSEFISILRDGHLGRVTDLVPIERQKLTALIGSIEQKADALKEESVGEKVSVLQNALRTLQHRKMLSEQLPAIKTYVDLKRWIARGQCALGSTRHITTKYNELFQELVTDRFVKLFQWNLSRFDRNLRIAVATRGQKGETVRHIGLNREVFDGSYSIDGVLSEGEKRAVALADFLTEAELDECCTAIVIDDPVSSFDLGARRALARRLVELARSRQVVVFTHDLVFLYELKTQAKALSVGTVTHWIQRGQDGTPGLVFLDNSPACEGDFKHAQLARERYAKAKSAPPQEQQWLLEQGFGALRTSYEPFVIFGLFESVIERFEERISFGRLTDVSLDPEIVREVVTRMESISRHIDAHLHSDSFGGEKPGPETLLEEIEAFEKLRKKHSERKKAAQRQEAVARPPALAPADREPARKEPAATSVEASELERRQRLANQLRPRN